MNSQSIEQTALECVEYCVGSTDVFPKIRAYLAALRLQGWPENEVQAVERGVIKALFGVSPDPGMPKET